MKPSKWFLSVSTFSLSLSVFANTGNPYECEIDIGLKKAAVAANVASQQEIKNFMEPPKEKPSERACIPTLSKLGAGLSMSLPSFSDLTVSLVSKIRDSACESLDSAVASVAGQAKAGWEAPYGLGAAGVSATTDGQGFTTDTTYKEPPIIQEGKDALGWGVSKTINGVGDGIESDVGSIFSINNGGKKLNDKASQNWRKYKDKIMEGI